jgi:hypothetical protein
VCQWEAADRQLPTKISVIFINILDTFRQPSSAYECPH